MLTRASSYTGRAVVENKGQTLLVSLISLVVTLMVKQFVFKKVASYYYFIFIGGLFYNISTHRPPQDLRQTAVAGGAAAAEAQVEVLPRQRGRRLRQGRI